MSISNQAISIKQLAAFLQSMMTRDAKLTAATTLHAEVTPKTLATGSVYTGDPKPVSDLDVEKIAQSFILALNGFSSTERAKIVAQIAKSGSEGWQAEYSIDRGQ